MDYEAILRQYFGFASFRGIQRPIIESICGGNDTLGLMPTGGGKSITFQVPALAQEGICIVITPLIALMKDQVTKLRDKGIKAAAIYSGMGRDAIVGTLENCIFGSYKFLYISPERIDTDIFKNKVQKMKVSFITVDESHCISQWGYDFRPSYLAISHIRDLLPHVPVLALTATATPEVVTDIQQKLCFKKKNVFRMSFARENLVYVVRETENKDAEMVHILQRVPGSAIVYVRSRDKTKEIAKLLSDAGIRAIHYHAGLSDYDKDQRQQAWTRGDIRVMVATNAFGMGIDKADVRMVLHYEMPDSPEAYFQEAGRGGRDGTPAYAVLLYHHSDQTKLSRRVSDNYPGKDFIRKVYEKLSYYFTLAMGDGQGYRYDFSLEDFCSSYHLPMVQTESALRILTQMGYIQYEPEADYASRLMFIVRRDDLYGWRSGTEEQETVIRSILRLYTGLFTDYAFIDEHFIARQSGLEEAKVYEALVRLARSRVISYVPSRRTSQIAYLRPRVDESRLVFTPAVYENRRESFEKRIKAMKHYALSKTDCRSRLLLSYFGEKGSLPCGKCDNCRRRQPESMQEKEWEEIHRQVLDLLADGEKHSSEELKTIPFPLEKLRHVVRRMVDEEEIILEEGMIMSKE